MLAVAASQEVFLTLKKQYKKRTRSQYLPKNMQLLFSLQKYILEKMNKKIALCLVRVAKVCLGMFGFLLLLSATGGTGKEILPLAGAGMVLIWLAGRG